MNSWWLQLIKGSALLLPWGILGLLNVMFFKLGVANFSALVFWYYTPIFFGLIFYPVMASCFPSAPDKGYGISKVVSMLVVVYLNWVLVQLNLSSFSSPGILFGVILLLLFLHIQEKREKRKDWGWYFKKYYQHILAVEFLYCLVFCLLLAFHSYHPEIYWGEKPMDFNILGYLNRRTTLPIEDPWFSGAIMHYYYFGYYFFAGLMKMSGIPAEVGYALSVASVGGLFASSCYSLFQTLTKRWMLSIGGSLALSMAGNWRSFWGIFFDRHKIDMNFFWSSTRVFKQNFFAEYPSWSFLFADLHPHVMAYPFGICLLFFFYHFIQHRNETKGHWYWFLFSLLWGSLMVINSWDYILYSILFFFLILFNYTSSKRLKDFLLLEYGVAGLLFLGSVALFSPMVSILSTGKKIYLSLYQGEHNTFSSFFAHQGHWWLILFFMLFPKVLRFIFRKSKFKNSNRFVLGLTLGIIILAMLGENFVFMDRMNTLFKTFNLVYILTGVLAIWSMRYFRFNIREKRLMPLGLFVIVIWNSIFLGCFFNLKAINSYSPFGSQRPTLRGSLYLKKMNIGDFDIINWINLNVEGTPTIVERYGKSFDHRTARISSHTGLPAYLGWAGHVNIRGVPLTKIKQRKAEIDYIYKSHDPLKVYEFMQNKKLTFLMVGPVEELEYGRQSMLKFSQYSDLFVPLHQSRTSTLYGVGNYKEYLRGQ